MFIFNCLQSLTNLAEKKIECNQDIMERKGKINNSIHLSLATNQHKGKDTKLSNLPSLWYNFSTLTTPLNCKNMKILQEKHPNDSCQSQACLLDKFQKNSKHLVLLKQTPKTYKSIYENRQNNKNSK